ncbi:MAG: Ribosomal RNA small subunit methyltransferase G [Candidatus Dichloromethanomonas elyunquensis]|nr:MAG: Ribosomal RNA small subunit methyltransferase G [Candidatus Dichloromethanomonas elyunquensis]
MAESILEHEISRQICLLKETALETFGIMLTDEHLSKFLHYTHLLLEWNQRVNLTAITDPAGIMVKHFLDSMIFVQWIQNEYSKEYPQVSLRIGDLGTGAGFPGIPIKILLPETEVYLIDALAKRITFLDIVIDELGLSQIYACHARAEDIGRNPLYRESFDLIAARAVAELPVLLEYAIPLLQIGGRLLAAKGLDPEKEISSAEQAFRLLNCSLDHLEKYRLAKGADHRSLVIVKKSGRTGDKYPRPAGKPKKNPL